MASGDGWAVDVWETYPVQVRSGDGWAVDGFFTAGPTGMATISVDTVTTINSREVGMATMPVDLLLTATPSPARLKVWDGANWVPIKLYYFDTTTQSWVANA